MKKLFALSISLNVALLGATGMLVAVQFHAVENQPQLQPARSPDAVTTLPSSTLPESLQTKSFHWNQLEADDYTSYISNLRGIGCPEATIRRLVRAEIHDIYAEQRRELETRMSGHAASQTLAAEIQKMATEETALLESVFQSNVSAASSSQGAAANVAPAGTDSRPTYAELTVRVPRVQNVSMPLAFQIGDAEPTPATLPNQIPDANATPLTDAQREAVETSRKEFVDAIGGDKQDPNAPEYLRRWQKAQWVAEEQLRAQLGDELYNRMQIQVAQREYSASGVR